jgi:hypothetical protein
MARPHCLVHGRLRVPFNDYERPVLRAGEGDDEYVGLFAGLPPSLRALALRRFAAAEAQRPLAHDRMKYLGRIAGIASAVLGARVGDWRWAHQMLAKRAGQALARHAPHILKRGRERLAARRAFDQAVLLGQRPQALGSGFPVRSPPRLRRDRIQLPTLPSPRESDLMVVCSRASLT